MCKVGDCYAYGISVAKDDELAFKWYCHNANSWLGLGHINSELGLGHINNGLGLGHINSGLGLGHIKWVKLAGYNGHSVHGHLVHGHLVHGHFQQPHHNCDSICLIMTVTPTASSQL